MMKTRTPLLGWAFNDVLNELHQIVFEGVPGETPPFELDQLEREYVAYVLACYYQCEHCMRFHEKAINRLREQDQAAAWDWQQDLVSATLYLHLDGRKLSATEWDNWVGAWTHFSEHIDHRQRYLSSHLAYAVGIARHDEKLMDLAFAALSEQTEDNQRLKGIVRDIDSVVIFMKAATSKNRSDATITSHLRGRGITEI